MPPQSSRAAPSPSSPKRPPKLQCLGPIDGSTREHSYSRRIKCSAPRRLASECRAYIAFANDHVERRYFVTRTGISDSRRTAVETLPNIERTAPKPRLPITISPQRSDFAIEIISSCGLPKATRSVVTPSWPAILSPIFFFRLERASSSSPMEVRRTPAARAAALNARIARLRQVGDRDNDHTIGQTMVDELISVSERTVRSVGAIVTYRESLSIP